MSIFKNAIKRDKKLRENGYQTTVLRTKYFKNGNTKRFVSRHIDSSIWQSVSIRPGDIILGSYAKSGTTWLQNILCQLVHGAGSRINVNEVSPWIESKLGNRFSVLDQIEKQTHRRILKTHLPLTYFDILPEVKYVYIARDAVDVAWSLHHHHMMANKDWYSLLNNQDIKNEKFSLPIEDKRSYFFNWLYSDGHPFWPYSDNIRSWWKARYLNNVFVLHYKNLTLDFDKTVLMLASFLETNLSSDGVKLIKECSSFEYMRVNAELFAPNGGKFWLGGAKTFFNKGKDGEWNSELSQVDLEEYETFLKEVLGKQCLNWIRKGEVGATEKLSIKF
ncbi:sulfotransferase domain-containing protein [Teredinibacter turnerae]|uniref:sulfotransferase domain-containing protein n=1 Tax=Teredinibacter turnerae TaxID=2426 RepID=UPI0006978895|nr:sulfotransferase domain-containing protein [Teredinibacter turnerae]